MNHAESDLIPDLDILTPRELEVFKLIADGYSLLEIAHQLKRSLKTIESHRLSLGRKLNVSDRVDLTKIAIANGLTGLTPRSAGGQTKRLSHESNAAVGPALHLIQQIAERIDSSAGLDMLKELANALCGVLKIQHAGVSVIDRDDDGTEYFSTLAYSKAGQIEDLVSYKKNTSPCAIVLSDGFHAVEQGVAKSFPDDQGMVDADAEYYAGLRLCDKQGRPIGVLWVADSKKRSDTDVIRALFEQVEPRVAATADALNQTNQTLKLCEEREQELESLYREVKNQNQHLDHIADYYCNIAERMSDGLIILNTDYTIRYLNEKSAQIIGDERDRLIGQAVDERLTASSQHRFREMQVRREADDMPHYRVTIVRFDGDNRDVLVAPRALYDEHGEFAGSFAVLTDSEDIETAEKDPHAA